MFRREVISQQGQRLQGRVLLLHSGTLLFWCVIFLVLFVIALAFIAKASYSKKKVTQGYIVSSKAISRHAVNKHSIVNQVYVKEGSVVKRGQKLVRLQSNVLVNEKGVSSVNSTESLLKIELTKVEREKDLLKLAFRQSVEFSKLESEQLKTEIKLTADQLNLSKSKLKLAGSMLGRSRLLAKKGFLTSQDLEQTELRMIDAQTYFKQNEQKFLTVKRALVKLENRKQNLKHDYESNLLKLERQKSQLLSDLATIESEAERYILAKVDGVVSNILLREGEYVKPGVSVLDVRPLEAIWQALLLLPSGSSGEIYSGQAVAIRMDAFPYQRFGTLKGTINKVDQTLVHPDELRMEIRSQAAVYRVWVDIDSQFLSAQGKQFPLRHGMRLSADVEQERRTLLSWLVGSLRSAFDRL